MATYKKGLNGPASGKVGSVIASSWRDINYFKGHNKKSTKEPTEKQLQSRAKFRAANNFLSLVNECVQLAFIQNPERMTGRNAAQSHILTKAWKESPEGGEIDYPNVLISFGKLEPVQDARVMSTPTGITINWDKKAAKSQQMIIALVDTQRELVMESVAEINRQAGEYTFDLSNTDVDFNFHVYIGTISRDRKNASNSLYLNIIRYPTP
ncbi:hypothetical protein B0I27_101456 [Arcticibacter pallidicorallinus]|uniref:Uncharacterized protein n=1 Tax=Arcticibacter pallidicorallinus TaxID=1259464 RepID=A0A2T0UC21_9SPHI|nr:DUF6266 family protein [Arcticibacter pallidicorallinus]PRY55485.1 hypothetical protein B0I27_101456 [Arcticibacter pallidicorallinus]